MNIKIANYELKETGELSEPIERPSLEALATPNRVELIRATRDARVMSRSYNVTRQHKTAGIRYQYRPANGRGPKSNEIVDERQRRRSSHRRDAR